MSERPTNSNPGEELHNALRAMLAAEVAIQRLNQYQPGNVSCGLTAVANQLWLARAGLLALGNSLIGAEMEPAEAALALPALG